MSNVRNEGFHVLDDFVCKVTNGPFIAGKKIAKQGELEGATILGESVFNGRSNSTRFDDVDDLIRSEAERLMSLIKSSPDPANALARCQELLRATLDGDSSASR